jgi:hypothetical protein
MAIAIKEKPQVREVGKITAPSFREPSTMTEEELTDPDYRLKQVMKQFGGNKKGQPSVCSKCHHCR